MGKGGRRVVAGVEVGERGRWRWGGSGGGGGGGLSDQAHVFELLLLQEMHRAQGYSSRVRYY